MKSSEKSSSHRLGWPAICGLTLLGIVIPLAVVFHDSPPRHSSHEAEGDKRIASRTPASVAPTPTPPASVAATRVVPGMANSPTAPTKPGTRTPLVVIDPGHGGSNRGAFGPQANRHEKQLTLALARRVRDALRAKHPGVRVRLTRNRDRYLTLSQRARLANQWRADTFISLHFNASLSRTQSGFETYVLSTEATDKEAMRLAAKENRDHAHSTDPMPEPGQLAGLDRDLRAILTDLKQRQLQLRSLRLAQHIQSALAKARPRADNRGVRQAPFDVLMGLRMPAALVEVGFIDHALEGPQLRTDAHQRRVAEALAAAISRFVGAAQPMLATR